MITFETVSTFQLIPALVQPDDLSQANTWFLSSLRGIQICGPLTSGLLMTFIGVRSCIWINIVSFSATLYFVFKMKNLHELIDGKDPIVRPPVSFQSMMTNFTESIKYVWESPLFKPFIVLMAFWNFSSLLPNTPSLIYYFSGEFHFTPAEYGSVVSVIGVMGILGYLISGPLYGRLEFNRIFVGSAVWQAVLATLSLAFLSKPLILAGIFAVSRVGSATLNMGTFLLRQTRIPKSRMGGINSCLRMFFMSAAPVSAVMQGLLIQKFGVTLSFSLGAVCLWGAVWYSREVGFAFQPLKTEKPRVAA